MANDQEDGSKHQVTVELVESQRLNGSNNMKQDLTGPGAECHDPQQADSHHHPNQKSQSFCAGCSGPIRDKFIFSVIDLYWHQDCVKCSDCKQNLNERCYTYEGKLYCRQDYWLRFGPKCFACRQSIDQSELVQRIKGNRVYHLKCFTCNECHRQLEQGEQLHLIDDKKLICRQDFQRISPHTTHNNDTVPDGCVTTTSSKNGFSGQETQSSYFTLLGSSSTPKSSIESLKHRSSLTSLDNIHDLKKDGDMAPDELGLDSAEERENNHLLDGDEENRLAGASDLLDQTATSDASLNLPPNTKISTTTNTTAITKQSQANALKRKRRRKQRLMAGGGGGEDEQVGRKLQGVTKESKTSSSKLLLAATNRSGESILNGGPGSGATTILAQEKIAGHHQLHHPDQQVSCSSSSSSSASSTSSSHSTSSNSTSSQRQQGGGSSGAHHPNHNHHHHHHQQQNNHHLHHHHHHHHHDQSSAGKGGPGNGGSGGGGGHKPTRVRTVLNEKQLQTLRDCYANNPRPDALMKEQLVDMTGLSSRVIRVWFQNKRCKDKKKSILYKQMQQHEKDGRHLAGLTHIRGVPMVAASPIHYQDDHSSAAATPPPAPPASATAGANSNEPDQLAITSVQSPQLIQQQQQQAGAGSVDSAPASHQAIDIHAYQPPWKGLADYAQQQGNAADSGGGGGPIDPASPRYQQLIGQIHGYPPNEHQVAAPEPQSQYSVAVPPPRPPTSVVGGGDPGPYPSPAQPHPGLMQSPMPTAHHHHHHHHHQLNHHHQHNHHTHLGQPAALMAAPMDSGGLHLHQFQH